MSSPKKVIPVYLFIDLIFLIIGVLGVIQIYYKSGLPFQIDYRNDKLILSSSDLGKHSFTIGSEILEVNGNPVNNILEVEFVLDGIRAGEEINVQLKFGDELNTVTVKTTHFYKLQYLISASLVGLLFFLLAILVLLKQQTDKEARIFHSVCILTGVIITTTWGYYEAEPEIFGILVRTAFSIAYVFAPALFLHFTIVYPRDFKFKTKYALPIIYSIALVLAAGTSWSFSLAVSEKTTASIQTYLSFFNLSQYFLAINSILGLAVFLISYRTVKETSEKQKLKWILFGLFAGLTPYIIFWVLPLIIWGAYFVPEDVILLFTMLIPITFVISIIRYRILNVNLIIERSIVYLIASLVLLLVASGLIIGISTLLKIKENLILSVIVAIIVAILFQPTYKRIQNFVDKKFFRVRYDFRNALRKFLREINEMVDIQTLADTVVIKTNALIPVNKIGFFNLDSSSNRLHLLAHINFDLLAGRSVRLQLENLNSDLILPVVLSDKVEQGAEIEVADVRVFKRWGMEIVFPIRSANRRLYGFLVLGEKLSQTKFSLEDVDLLSTIATRISGILDRLTLQSALIREQLEVEKLEEVNRLKSFFISSVTHDLKTPLTSIKMFSELLRTNSNLQNDKKIEFLKIIEGESDRLARLINSVLDFVKIEKGIKEYNFEPLEINPVIKDVLKSMQYQIEMEGFKVIENLCCDRLIVGCDKDAFIEALINLIDNSIKYSPEKKIIDISTYKEKEFLCVSVKDEGIGIKEDELLKILDPYYRATEEVVHKRTGVGLGLSIIKHIMNAHSGRIEVESKWGCGSNFKIYFPLLENNRFN